MGVTEQKITPTAQKTTHFSRCMVVIYLQCFTRFPAYCTAPFLHVHENFVFFI